MDKEVKQSLKMGLGILKMVIGLQVMGVQMVDLAIPDPTDLFMPVKLGFYTAGTGLFISGIDDLQETIPQQMDKLEQIL